MAPSTTALRQPAADMRRGLCPTLGQPMQTGDGLLARLRPIECGVTLGELRAIAEAAKIYGNGILEVTARGSLQIRGLRPETVAPFERAVLASGIVPAMGVMVDIAPLSGIDPEELTDARPIAAALREAIAEHRPPLALAPKLAITVDGGGRFHLCDVTADVRLTAIGEGRFLLAVGGTERTARLVAVIDERRAVASVLVVLEAIAAIGPMARGREVELAALGEIYDPPRLKTFVRAHSPQFLGLHEFVASPPSVLGIGLPYRQADAASLITLIGAFEALGISDIRLSPGHGFFVTGLDPDAASQAEYAARNAGFWTSSDEPGANIAVCSGTAGCASAQFDTKATAELVLKHASILLDGSMAIHLSGCAKGCAHPTAAPLTLAGAPSGYGLVVNGAASNAPLHYIAAKDMGNVLERLASLVAGAKDTGETARACLARLGVEEISVALERDGQ